LKASISFVVFLFLQAPELDHRTVCSGPNVGKQTFNELSLWLVLSWLSESPRLIQVLAGMEVLSVRIMRIAEFGKVDPFSLHTLAFLLVVRGEVSRLFSDFYKFNFRQIIHAIKALPHSLPK